MSGVVRSRIAKIYFALMIVVCAAVVAGPASSGTITSMSIHGGFCDIINFSVNNDDYKVFNGQTWDGSVVYNGVLDATVDGLVKLGSFDATCTLDDQDCSFGIGFTFNGSGFSNQVTFGMSLIGSSTDYARGTFDLDIVHDEMVVANNSLDFSSQSSGFNVGPLSLVANLPGGSWDPPGAFQAQAHLNVGDLVKGSSMSLSNESADITYLDTDGAGGVPEPGSAVLLLGGFAMMEFVRRKVRG